MRALKFVGAIHGVFGVSVQKHQRSSAPKPLDSPLPSDKCETLQKDLGGLYADLNHKKDYATETPVFHPMVGIACSEKQGKTVDAADVGKRIAVVGLDAADKPYWGAPGEVKEVVYDADGLLTAKLTVNFLAAKGGDAPENLEGHFNRKDGKAGTITWKKADGKVANTWYKSEKPAKRGKFAHKCFDDSHSGSFFNLGKFEKEKVADEIADKGDVDKLNIEAMDRCGLDEKKENLYCTGNAKEGAKTYGIIGKAPKGGADPFDFRQKGGPGAFDGVWFAKNAALSWIAGSKFKHPTMLTAPGPGYQWKQKDPVDALAENFWVCTEEYALVNADTPGSDTEQGKKAAAKKGGNSPCSGCKG